MIPAFGIDIPSPIRYNICNYRPKGAQTMKSALKLVGYIIAFLLMAAGLVSIVLYIMGLGSNLDDLEIITTMTPVEEATPTPYAEPTPTPFIAVTPTPTPTPEPTATPEPTPEPTPTVTPYPAGIPIGTGKISSDTGVWLNIDTEWYAETIDEHTAKVIVTVNLRSFRMNAPATKKTLEIKLHDQTYTADVGPLIIETETEVVTELAKHEFTIYAPVGQNTTIDLITRWQFDGVYSGKELDEIVSEGFVTLIR